MLTQQTTLVVTCNSGEDFRVIAPLVANDGNDGDAVVVSWP